MFIAPPIKMLIYQHYYLTEPNKKANKDSSKSNYMNKLIYRVENFENEYTDGAVEIEYGNEIYFGIQVDEAELNRQLQMISELIESKKEILVNKLGSTRLKGNNEMTEKFNELGIRVNRLSGKCIRDAMRKYGTESEQYKLLKEYSEYRSAEKNWSYLRNIRDSIKQGRVRMANMPGTLGMETAGYAVEHDLLKPTDGYTIIQISTERAAVFNLMNRLSMNPVEEPVDWFKHIAAKAFNVDDITNLSEEQRGTARDIMISLGYKDVERILNDKILYSERELTFKQNVKDVINALKQKSFIGAITDLRMTNLSREVKNILKTMGKTNAYNVCKNIVNIDKALTNHIILKVREYFGATNLRVRLVGEYYGYLLYEIANDSVDEFKNFISCDIINLGDKRLNVEINKVIEEV